MRRREFSLSLLSAPALLGQSFPRPAMDVLISIPGRASLKLSEYKGKVIGVEWLLTTCSHCQAAARLSEAMYREYGPKGYQPVGIAINPDADPAAFAREQKLTFPVGMAPQGVAVTFLQWSPVRRMMLPQIALVDRSFQIAAQYMGEVEVKVMREQIEKLLASR